MTAPESVISSIMIDFWNVTHCNRIPLRKKSRKGKEFNTAFSKLCLLLFFLSGFLVPVSTVPLIHHPPIAGIICVPRFITARAADMGKAGSVVSDIVCEKEKWKESTEFLRIKVALDPICPLICLVHTFAWVEEYRQKASFNSLMFIWRSCLLFVFISKKCRKAALKIGFFHFSAIWCKKCCKGLALGGTKERRNLHQPTVGHKELDGQI